MNILVLCHGNKYRSPACAAVLKSVGCSVDSAGFRKSSEMAAASAREFMARKGFDLSQHRCKEVSLPLLRWADMIVYMDNGNKKRLLSFLGSVDLPSRKPVLKCLGVFVKKNKIFDPAFYKKDSVEFAQIFEDIIAASYELARQIKGRQEEIC